MANHMAEVAKMLGVELGERFIIHNNNGRFDSYYYFTTEGVFSDCSFGRVRLTPDALQKLICGEYTIQRNPWKPEYGDAYYFIEPDGSIKTDSWFIDSSTNTNYYKLGNCYRTREEAEANRDKWVKFYASDEVLEV